MLMHHLLMFHRATWLGLLASLLWVSAGGCGDRVRDDVTGIDLTIQFTAAQGIAEFEVRGFIGGNPTFGPNSLLPPGNGTFTSGEETVVILLDPSYAGQTVTVRVEPAFRLPSALVPDMEWVGEYRQLLASNGFNVLGSAPNYTVVNPEVWSIHLLQPGPPGAHPSP